MNIAICACTRESADTFFKKSPLGKTVLNSCHHFVQLHTKFENTDGLGQSYNEFIEEHQDNYDVLLFVHDDVYIDDRRLGEKLQEAMNDYDIIGLAGTSQFEVKHPAVWNNSPRDAWSGAVGHQHEGNTWMTSFGNIPKRCIIVDGLFMAVKTKCFKEGLRFDPQFTFNHYDLDFCLSAHKMGYKIGTAPIWVTHTSIGDWTSSSDWKKCEPKFLEKWKSS